MCKNIFVVAPPPHPRQRLLSLDSGKGFKSALLEFLPLFLQKESGFQGSALRTQKGESLHTLYRLSDQKK